MANTATLTVYNGQSAYRVTGKIVKQYPSGGVCVDDERGVRHFAPKHNVTLHIDNSNVDTGNLW